MSLTTRWSLFSLLLIGVLAGGCVHLVPMPYGSQREEAKALGKQLKSLTPEARNVALSEHKLARELRVVLDELAKLPLDDFRKRFESYTNDLVKIQAKRREILASLEGRHWNSPMVLAVHEGAVEQLRSDMSRTQRLIELTEGVRLRVELGRTEGFPELAMVSHRLDIFLASKTDLEPFSARLEALREAFNLQESDFN